MKPVGSGRVLRQLLWSSKAKADTSGPSKLCSGCAQSLIKTVTYRHIEYHRHECSFCSLLHRSIKAYKLAKLPSVRRRHIDRVHIRRGLKHQLDVTFEGEEKAPAILQNQLRDHLYLRQRFKGTFQLRELLTDTKLSSRKRSSIIDWSLVRRWMSVCDHEHGVDCQRLHRHTLIQRPHKLVLIDVVSMCLIQAEGDVEYAALSYVWGLDVQQLGLSASNREDLFKRQSLTKPVFASYMTATVSDAIYVTREIGLRYLWVDTLCIQQDQRIDTAYQVANMHNIFGSSHVTIVAAQGLTANAGLRGTPSTPRPMIHRQAVVKYKAKPLMQEINGGLLGLIGDRMKPRQGKTIFSPYTEIRDTKWHSRGWTMQEWLLSNRYLIFSDDQVFWHCNKTVWCEDSQGREHDPHGFAVDPRYQPLRNITAHWHFKDERGGIGSLDLANTSAFKLYKDLVERYTRREVRDVDKLAAFDGLSNMLEQKLQASVSFGLPETTLDSALLWQPVTTIRRIHGIGLPSWSWAGWQGAVQYPHRHADRHNIMTGPGAALETLVTWQRPASDGSYGVIDNSVSGLPGLRQKWQYFLDRWRQQPRTRPGAPPHTLMTNTMRNSLVVHKPEDIWYSAETGKNEKLGYQRIANYFCIYSPKSEEIIGEVVLDDVEDAASLIRHQHQIELIVVSKTQLFRSHRMNHGPTGNLAEHPTEYRLYNLMAVRRQLDGKTVSRIGLGKVYIDQWHKAAPTWDWIYIT